MEKFLWVRFLKWVLFGLKVEFFLRERSSISWQAATAKRAATKAIITSFLI